MATSHYTRDCEQSGNHRPRTHAQYYVCNWRHTKIIPTLPWNWITTIVQQRTTKNCICRVVIGAHTIRGSFLLVWIPVVGCQPSSCGELLRSRSACHNKTRLNGIAIRRVNMRHMNVGRVCLICGTNDWHRPGLPALDHNFFLHSCIQPLLRLVVMRGWENKQQHHIICTYDNWITEMNSKCGKKDGLPHGAMHSFEGGHLFSHLSSHNAYSAFSSLELLGHEWQTVCRQQALSSPYLTHSVASALSWNPFAQPYFLIL